MLRLALLIVAGCSAAAPIAPRPTGGGIRAPGLRLPGDVAPAHYDLRLAIDPAQETFTGEVQIAVTLAQPADHVWLHAVDLEITRASWEAGALAEVGRGDQMIALGFGTRAAAGRHVLTIAYTGHTSRDEEGLFRQRDRDRWYVFSQGESVLTRRYVPCLDEPRWKVPWHVTLDVPKDLVALGNTPAVRETVHGATKEVELAETPAIPSYLLAVAVGPFELVDLGVAGANKLPVRVAALAGDRGQVGVAARTPAVLAAIEAYTGTPLAWPKLDLVAVPHLFGAMENPGLITFDADMLVGDPRDKDLVRHFVQVVAHELVHQWFGNSVTPAWWDDLWIAEAFASWLGDKVAVQLGALDDAGLELALAREQALDADGDLDARPLHRRVDGNADPDNAFDAISYEKGQAVLATFEAFVGADRMRDALRGYLAAHAGGTATRADVVEAIGVAGGPEVAAAFAGYLEHVGAPVVTAHVRCGRDAPVLELSASGLAVPVCFRGDRIARTCVVAHDHTEVPLATCPAWLWANDGAGYYELDAPSVRVAQLARLSEAERIAVGDDFAGALERGGSPTDAVVALAALRRLAESHDAYEQLGALAIARALDPLVDDARRPAWQAWLAARFADRMTAPALLAPGKPADRELRDALLGLVEPPADARARAREILATLLPKGDIPPELVAVAAPERATLERLAKIAELEPTRRDAMIDALATGPADGAAIAVELVAGRGLPAWSAIEGYFARGATRTAAWQALRPRLREVLQRLTPAERAQVIDATAGLCDGASEVEAAFAPHLPSIEDGRRHLTHAVAQIARCADRRSKLGNLPL